MTLIMTGAVKGRFLVKPSRIEIAAIDLPLRVHHIALQYDGLDYFKVAADCARRKLSQLKPSQCKSLMMRILMRK